MRFSRFRSEATRNLLGNDKSHTESTQTRSQGAAAASRRQGLCWRRICNFGLMFTPSSDGEEEAQSRHEPSGNMGAASSGSRQHSRSPAPHSRGRHDRPRIPGGFASAWSHEATPQDPAAWPALLARGLEECLGRETRGWPGPLQLVTAFSGMGSQERALLSLKIPFHAQAAAEPKRHALEFARLNSVVAAHHFLDIRNLVSAGVPAYCAVHRQECPSPVSRPDLFSAGFPCQPTSAMRGRHRTTVPPQQHPEFEACRLVMDYLRSQHPRLALLEQTAGATFTSKYDEVAQSEVEWLKGQLTGFYHISWCFLDLATWLSMRRRRVWIFCVATDVGTQAAADKAARLAQQLDAWRGRHDRPVELRGVLYKPTDEEAWPRVLMTLLPGGRHDRPEEPELVATRAWARQCESTRSAWRQAGHPWADAHPLADSSMAGMSSTPRVRELLEVHLLKSCLARGHDPGTQVGLRATKRELWADASQSLDWLTPHARNGLAPTVCRNTTLYDYASDRRVLPEEILRASGWPSPTCTGISLSDMTDLVGDSQAVPVLATATLALLHTAPPRA